MAKARDIGGRLRKGKAILVAEAGVGTKFKDQQIHWVSGKGGVGKSTVAAAMAMRFARAGKKTLLVELGEKSFYRYVFDVDVNFEPKLLETNLSLVRWSGEECLKEYFLYLLKLEKVVQLFFENRVMKSLVQAAPGLKELALVGKITSGIRGVGPNLPYDVVVIDAFATGHFRTLLESPAAMAQAIPVGPMGEQSRSIDQVLKEGRNTHYHVVMIPEELPVTEGLELMDFVHQHFGLQPRAILNRFIEAPVTRGDIQVLAANEFLSYLDFLLERQERLLKTIPQPLVIPYDWKKSARERTEDLAERAL